MAARRIAEHTGVDPLWDLANSLMSDGNAHVAWVASGSFGWQKFTAAFPPVIVLDGDIESLSAELERAIVSIHDQLWAFDPTIESPSGGPERLMVGEFVNIGGWGKDLGSEQIHGWKPGQRTATLSCQESSLRTTTVTGFGSATASWPPPS